MSVMRICAAVGIAATALLVGVARMRGWSVEAALAGVNIPFIIGGGGIAAIASTSSDQSVAIFATVTVAVALFFGTLASATDVNVGRAGGDREILGGAR